MGERIVITGGEGGLAQALAAAFAGTAADEIATPGRGELDVTDAAQVAAWFAGRPVDLLVCNAGTVRDAALARLCEEDWDRVIEANLHGAARCAAAVAGGMAERGRGHIVFLSSFSALHPPAGQAAYAAAKAGLLGLMKSLARELGPAGVRVNAILPGFLETPMTAGVGELRRREVRGDHVLGRFNTSAAVAAFLVHLHRWLPHTSGQIFQLDSRVA